LLPCLFTDLRFIRWCIYQSYKAVNEKFIFFGGQKVYKNHVPNQRAPGQKLMPVPVDEQFLRELDTGMKRAGYQNRSQFVAMPPQRTGKNAPAKIIYPAHKPSGYELNERKKRR
jgi:hypothetical protein